MRRKYLEIVMSIGAVGLILLVLISFDSRVREAASQHWKSGPTAELVTTGQQANHLMKVVVQAARDHGMATTPMLLLVFGAGVLLVLMLRT